MVRSKETKLINFLAGVSKYNNIGFNVKNIVIEYHDQINGILINPDVLLFFDKPSDFYSLFEIKRRTTPKTDSDLIIETNNEIIPQYQKYQTMKTNLDQLNTQYLPAIPNTPFYLNYLFYNTDSYFINCMIKIV